MNTQHATVNSREINTLQVSVYPEKCSRSDISEKNLFSWVREIFLQSRQSHFFNWSSQLSLLLWSVCYRYISKERGDSGRKKGDTHGKTACNHNRCLGPNRTRDLLKLIDGSIEKCTEKKSLNCSKTSFLALRLGLYESDQRFVHTEDYTIILDPVFDWTTRSNPSLQNGIAISHVKYLYIHDPKFFIFILVLFPRKY